MNKLYVVGIGPGAREDMTIRAWNVLCECEVIAGYTVYVDLVRAMLSEAGVSMPKEYIVTSMMQEEARVMQALAATGEGKKVALVGSGDASVYGLAGLAIEMAKKMPGVFVEVVPGVTAALSGSGLLGAFLGHDFSVISLSDLLTGWDTIAGRLEAAAASDMVIALYNPSSKKRADHLRRACDILLRYKSGETICGVARNIGREGESTQIVTLRELRELQTDMFTTVFVGNKSTKVVGEQVVTPRGYEKKHENEEKKAKTNDRLSFFAYLPDEAFLRNTDAHVPMTKYPVRVLSMNALDVRPGQVLYDVGAGTGSVTIEMARKCVGGTVYAIEKKKEAIDILRQNIAQFGVENIHVIEGKAPQVLADLPAADAVFIGGSSGNLREIIDVIQKKNPSVRFVVTAITLETMANLIEIAKEYEDYRDMQMMEVQANSVDVLAGYHMRHASNPVLIAVFGGK